jgi:hypothetical protein
MKVYMAVTKDRFQLPVAVADSAAELAELVGVCVNTVFHGAWRSEHMDKVGKYLRVEIDEEVS